MKLTLLAALVIVLSSPPGDGCSKFKGFSHTGPFRAGELEGYEDEARICVNEQERCESVADCDKCIIDSIPCMTGGKVDRREYSNFSFCRSAQLCV